MTQQVSDTVNFGGKWYSLADSDGSPLFHPKQIGIKTMMISTACVRGFYCAYEIRNSQFFLDRLNFGTPPEDKDFLLAGIGPRVFGQIPVWRDYYHALLVENISELIPFSGGLVLVSDFVEDFYIRGRHRPSYTFGDVRELILKDGVVQEVHDRSEQAARCRASLSPADDDYIPPPGSEQLKEWESSFICKYRGLDR